MPFVKLLIIARFTDSQSKWSVYVWNYYSALNQLLRKYSLFMMLGDTSSWGRLGVTVSVLAPPLVRHIRYLSISEYTSIILAEEEEQGIGGGPGGGWRRHLHRSAGRLQEEPRRCDEDHRSGRIDTTSGYSQVRVHQILVKRSRCYLW